MGNLLTFAFLFLFGAVFGWVVELFFRRFFSQKKWINPGFCTGPYLPIYGFGISGLYYTATLFNKFISIQDPVLSKVALFATMTVIMTFIEFTAGLLMLKLFKVRLWDYSNKKGNIMGLICPLFSFFWCLLSVAYYYLVHPYILDKLYLLSGNQIGSFAIGLFYGVFFIDLAHSCDIVTKIKHFAEANNVIVKYEQLKTSIRSRHEKLNERIHFIFPFKSEIPLIDHLKEAAKDFEKRIRN